MPVAVYDIVMWVEMSNAGTQAAVLPLAMGPRVLLFASRRSEGRVQVGKVGRWLGAVTIRSARMHRSLPYNVQCVAWEMPFNVSFKPSDDSMVMQAAGGRSLRACKQCRKTGNKPRKQRGR